MSNSTKVAATLDVPLGFAYPGLIRMPRTCLGTIAVCLGVGLVVQMPSAVAQTKSECPLNLIAKNVQRDHSSPYPPVHQLEIWFEPVEGQKAEAIKGLLDGPTKDEGEQNGAKKDEAFAFQITNDLPHPLRMATVDTGSLTKVRWLDILEIQFVSGG